MLILSQRDVEQLLTMPDCIEVMASALAALARGEAVLPLRTVVRIPDSRNAFATMPGYLSLGGDSVIGAKIVSIYPGNEGTAFDSHQGAVLLFDPAHGGVAAVLDGTPITAIRTAAVSAVATRLLARETATSLAIIGSGVQAHTHLRAMCAVRPIRTVRVYSPTRERAQRLVDFARREFGLLASVADNGEAAARDADIVCTATSSSEPVLLGEWLSAGAHVNAVGTSQPSARELDSAAVVRSRLYVDRRESALNEPGDILGPLHSGQIGPEHIVGEIGEVLIGRAPARRDANEITLFKSLGLAVEDLAAASFVYGQARKAGIGVEVELGGARLATH